MTKFNKLLLVGAGLIAFGLAPSIALSGEPGPNDSGKTVLMPRNGGVTATVAAPGALISDALILRPNMVEVITLPNDIGSIMLSDPRPVELIVENSRRVTLRPSEPGVTNLTIIDKAGQVMYKREIVVTQRGENYVRVQRYCEDSPCQEEDIYYCPNGCYGVKSTRDNSAGFAPVSTVGGGAVQDNYSSTTNSYPPPRITTSTQ